MTTRAALKPAQYGRAQAFIVDLLAVYKKHELALSHEDSQGAFIIVPRQDSLERWLTAAQIAEEVE